MKRLLFIVALCLPAAAWAGPEGRVYTQDKYFTVTLPFGWVKKEKPLGLTDEERKVYGDEFFGPVSGDLAARVGAFYYAPGNQVHATPERFLALNARPPLGVNVDGKVYGPVKKGRAGSCYAQVFERRNFEYEPKNALHPKKIHIYEKFYVVPVKNGFFVLSYYAPMDLARANLKHFEAFVASFKPLTR